MHIHGHAEACLGLNCKLAREWGRGSRHSNSKRVYGCSGRLRSTAPGQGHAPELAAGPEVLFTQRDAAAQQGDHHGRIATQDHIQAIDSYDRIGAWEVILLNVGEAGITRI